MTEPQWQNPVDPTAPPQWSAQPWSAQPAADPYASGPAAPRYDNTPGYTQADPAAQTGYGYGPPAQPSYGQSPYGGQTSYGGQTPYSAGQTPYAQPAQPSYGQSPYGGQQSPYAGYPYPGQPAPKGSGGKIALVIVLVLLVVGGLATAGIVLLGNDKKNTPTTSPTVDGSGPTGNPSAKTSSGPTTPVNPGQALYAKIVEPPSGSHEYELDKGVNGVFTAKQMVDQTFRSSESAAKLTGAGYVVGAGRDYQRPDGDEIVVFLLQFKKPDGAKSIYNYVISGREDDSTVTGKFTVPGGRGYKWDFLDKLGNRASEMYKVVGNVLILLNVYTPGDIDVSGDLQKLSDQVSLLS